MDVPGTDSPALLEQRRDVGCGDAHHDEIRYLGKRR
jgi:hypothetical protein